MISEYISKTLTLKRYLHILRVSNLCLRLAKKFKMDTYKAYVSGLAHDIAKEMSEYELINFCENNNIKMHKKEVKDPHLLHARVGAKILENDFGIKDSDILDAVRYHTLGNEVMCPNAMLLYICDRIEPAKSIVAKDVIENIFKQSDIKSAISIFLANYNISKFGQNKKIESFIYSLIEDEDLDKSCKNMLKDAIKRYTETTAKEDS